ncbi:hypothetical protein [Tepidiphilus margaritifer]|uniref:hypothetical protein n=1 Tax=Tepidiphilus margaritifer TaxID=203471 RepID=UPI0012F7F2E2|nr:hypothetical protein [Tepidiphilus margaritifer]
MGKFNPKIAIIRKIKIYRSLKKGKGQHGQIQTTKRNHHQKIYIKQAETFLGQIMGKWKKRMHRTPFMVERRSNTCYGSIPFRPVFRPVMPFFRFRSCRGMTKGKKSRMGRLQRVGYHKAGGRDAFQSRLSDNQCDLAHGQPAIERKGKYGQGFFFPFARGVARQPFRCPDAWMR